MSDLWGIFDVGWARLAGSEIFGEPLCFHELREYESKKKGWSVPVSARTLAIWIKQLIVEQACPRGHSHDTQQLLTLDTQREPQNRRIGWTMPSL